MRLRVSGSGEVVQLTRRHQMHALIQTDAEISEVLMKALIHRRVAVIAQGIGDVLLIGSVGSGATLRIKQFRTWNGHPFKYLDLDRGMRRCTAIARSLSRGAGGDTCRRSAAARWCRRIPATAGDRRLSRLQ